MQYFPLFIDLKHKPVLVVGGGEVASRKVESLVRAGAKVTIVAPQIEAYLGELVAEKSCDWQQMGYAPELLESKYVQVWATTDNSEINHQVYDDAKRKGVLVNVVDDQPYCDFITPSIINRGRIQLAISSGGAAPVLIRNIREKLEAVLGQNLALLADFAATKRADIKTVLPTVSERRKFWEVFFAYPEAENASSEAQLEAIYQVLRQQGIDQQALDQKGIAQQGSVTWVEYGADVELLTLKALKLMQQAELVLFAPDCPFEFVDLVRRDAERSEYHSAAQLSAMLAQAKSEQSRVVVLIGANSQDRDLRQAGDSCLTLGANQSL